MKIFEKGLRKLEKNWSETQFRVEKFFASLF